MSRREVRWVRIGRRWCAACRVTRTAVYQVGLGPAGDDTVIEPCPLVPDAGDDQVVTLPCPTCGAATTASDGYDGIAEAGRDRAASDLITD